MKKLAVTAIAIGAGIFSYKKVNAQEVSLGVYPPIIRLKADPGSKVSAPITVLNNSGSFLKIDIKAIPFYDSGNKDGSILYYSQKDISQRDSDFIKTLKFTDKQEQIESINLYPKEYKTINLEFINPKDQRKDYYFSVIFSEQISATKSAETKSFISTGAAVNVLLTSSRLENDSAVIESISAPQIVFKGPVKMTITVKNTSNHYESVGGNIYLFNTMGKKIDDLNLKPQIVLSDGSRNIGSNSQNRDIIIGNNSMFGLYTVKTEISSNGKVLAHKDIKVIAIPLLILIVLTLLLFIFLGIALRVLRKINLKN